MIPRFVACEETTRRGAWLVAAGLVMWGSAAPAQEPVQFRSLDAGSTMLDGYMYRVPGDGRHPAVVFLHGCGGMFRRSTGLINNIYQEWATALRGAGYSVLTVDSFRLRGIAITCSPATYNRAVVENLPMAACITCRNGRLCAASALP